MQTIYRNPPSLVNFIFSLIGPVITVAMLRAITSFYKINFDGPYMSLAIITFLISFVIFRELNVKASLRRGAINTQVKNVIISWVVLVGILLFLAYATKSSEEFSRRIILTWFTATPVIIFLGYSLARTMVFRYFSPERYGRTAAVVGINHLSKNIVKEIASDLRLGINFVGFFDDRSVERLGEFERDKLLGNLSDIQQYVQENQIDIIYITLPMVQEKRILNLLDELKDTTTSIYFVPDLFIFDLVNARIDDLNGIPVLAVCESPFYGVTGLLKRVSDFVIGLIILILISPIMAIIAILIKMDSPGPALFKQRRYGLDGDEIIVYKFRSMRVQEDDEVVKQATKDDDRITRLGKFLRRSSLDELPQFINVVQGRMSVVGPRPHAVAHNEEYRKLIKGYMIRHKVKPGITGWAQINGFRGETETIEKMKARIDCDLDYLRHWSLRLDLLIIMRTIITVINDKNAY